MLLSIRICRTRLGAVHRINRSMRQITVRVTPSSMNICFIELYKKLVYVTMDIVRQQHKWRTLTDFRRSFGLLVRVRLLFSALLIYLIKRPLRMINTISGTIYIPAK